MSGNKQKQMKNLETILKNIATIIAKIKQWNASEVEAICGAGQMRSVYMRRPVKVTKACPWQVFKVSGFQMQCGIKYANRAKVIAAKANGEVGTLTRPDYAKKMDGFRSVMVNRKDAEKGVAKPTYYLCGGIVEGNHYGSHFVDDKGNELTKAQVEPFLYASEQPKGEAPNWTRIKLQNLIVIN